MTDTPGSPEVRRFTRRMIVLEEPAVVEQLGQMAADSGHSLAAEGQRSDPLLADGVLGEVPDAPPQKRNHAGVPKCGTTLPSGSVRGMEMVSRERMEGKLMARPSR